MSGLLIDEVFRSAAGAAPHRPAVVCGDRALSFAELDAAADRAAGRLRACGVRRGDRVVCLTGDLFAALPLFAGAARAGAAFVPLDPLDRGAASVPVVRTAAPRLVVTDGPWAEAEAGTGARLAAAAGARHLVLPKQEELLVPAQEAATGGKPPGRPPRRPAGRSPSESDAHLVLFTGRTGALPGPTPVRTGAPRPRGVVLSHRVSALRTHPGSRPEPPGPLVCGFPPGHPAAWTAVLRQWQTRGTVVLPAEPGPAAVCAAVREHRAARLTGPPDVWWAVLDTAPHQLAPLRLAVVEAADPADTPPRLIEAVRTATPAALVRAVLGTPETGDIAALDHADVRARPGSCGSPAPGVGVRVVDGELWVRGPSLFDGYYGDAEATDAVLRNGWFRTGRTVRRDGDGYLYLGAEPEPEPESEPPEEPEEGPEAEAARPDAKNRAAPPS
ncbi:AMP-binding protein [Streptomyces sp. NPDC017941]|uniref:AMP-binding protein n=1 Tax=Streptomyces sp. NPDC017941 TaxID=3365018 RepID=UPI0037957BB1